VPHGFIKYPVFLVGGPVGVRPWLASIAPYAVTVTMERLRVLKAALDYAPWRAEQRSATAARGLFLGLLKGKVIHRVPLLIGTLPPPLCV
jgi:hypothetical protein